MARGFINPRANPAPLRTHALDNLNYGLYRPSAWASRYAKSYGITATELQEYKDAGLSHCVGCKEWVSYVGPTRRCRTCDQRPLSIILKSGEERTIVPPTGDLVIVYTKRSGMRNFRNLDDTFAFGKYIGQMIKEVIKKDPEYVMWCSGHVRNFEISEEVESALRRKLGTSPDLEVAA